MEESTLPLVVELDRTLVRSDTLVETWLRAVRRQPWILLLTPFWMLRGRAHLRTRLRGRVDLSAETLPYHDEFVDFLRRQRGARRPLILAHDGAPDTARRVFDHLGIFDRVLPAIGGVRARVQALVDEFGEGGYAYAGSGRGDLPLWNAGGAAVLVSTPPQWARRVGVPVEAEFPRERSRLRGLIKAMRTYQWVKNLLIFLPLITANGLTRISSLWLALGTFAAFSCLASGVYVVNDLFDLDADRRHPRKRRRPFASGTAPLGWGVVLGPLLMTVGVVGGFLLGFWVGVSLVTYAVATIAYSAFLKTQPLVDVFTLALLYTLRIVAGGVAVDEAASIWLLSFSSFFFLSLGFLKRHVEVSRLSPDEEIHRRGYGTGEDRPLLVMGIASSFAASIVLALYVETSVAEAIYPRPEAVWGFVPLSLFWQMRMWLAAERGFVHDDPITYAARDWVSLLVVLAAGVCYLAAVV